MNATQTDTNHSSVFWQATGTLEHQSLLFVRVRGSRRPKKPARALEASFSRGGAQGAMAGPLEGLAFMSTSRRGVCSGIFSVAGKLKETRYEKPENGGLSRVREEMELSSFG